VRLTVCELPDDARERERAWSALVAHLARRPTDVVVLPEMPFVEWAPFTRPTVDPEVWARILAEHDRMMPRLAELRAGAVLSSRPVDVAGRRLNQGFAWSRQEGYRAGRSKMYLPEEPDGWEATWFARGDLGPSPVAVDGLRIGFQMCTEMLFTELAWTLGHAGAHLIAAPRATGDHRRWATAASLMAIVSGCFVASANRRSSGDARFAGRSCIVSPEGELLAETTADAPFAPVDVDPRQAEAAKHAYPQNVPRG
jgi:N-carbamoylputrescine amidase